MWKIMQIFGAWEHDAGNSQLYHVRCSAFMRARWTLSFRLGGVDCSLSSKDLIISHQGDDCILGITTTRGPPLWIMGDVFMRMYYTVFDLTGYMGIAPAVEASQTSCMTSYTALTELYVSDWCESDAKGPGEVFLVAMINATLKGVKPATGWRPTKTGDEHKGGLRWRGQSVEEWAVVRAVDDGCTLGSPQCPEGTVRTNCREIFRSDKNESCGRGVAGLVSREVCDCVVPREQTVSCSQAVANDGKTGKPDCHNPEVQARCCATCGAISPEAQFVEVVSCDLSAEALDKGYYATGRRPRAASDEAVNGTQRHGTDTTTFTIVQGAHTPVPLRPHHIVRGNFQVEATTADYVTFTSMVVQHKEDPLQMTPGGAISCKLAPSTKAVFDSQQLSMKEWASSATRALPVLGLLAVLSAY